MIAGSLIGFVASQADFMCPDNINAIYELPECEHVHTCCRFAFYISLSLIFICFFFNSIFYNKFIQFVLRLQSRNCIFARKHRNFIDIFKY